MKTFKVSNKPTKNEKNQMEILELKDTTLKSETPRTLVQEQGRFSEFKLSNLAERKKSLRKNQNEPEGALGQEKNA
jgi:hypothetical protein